MVIRPNPIMDELVQDSGVLIENFLEISEAATSYDELIDMYLEAMDTPDYLGITDGGVESSLENETRIREYDGKRVRSVGDFKVDSSSPQISTSLFVHSIENMRRVYPMSDVTTENGRTRLQPRLGSPRPEDYMKSVSWIREMVNGDIKVVHLLHAINTENPTETGADKEDSKLAVVFTANAASWNDTEYAPMIIDVWKRPTVTPEP